jgi:hypothetical protein
MIILSDNPVDSMSNTKKIEAVIHNGHLLRDKKQEILIDLLNSNF